jgi:hypothetical protein
VRARVVEDWLDDRIEITDRDDLDPWKSAGGSTLGDGTMLGVAVAAGAGRRGWGCSTTGRRLVKANRSAINGLGQRQANGHQLIELIVLIKLR